MLDADMLENETLEITAFYPLMKGNILLDFSLAKFYNISMNVMAAAKIFYRETLVELEEIRFVEALFDEAYPDSPLFAGRIEAALTP